jgi:internalin A
MWNNQISDVSPLSGLVNLDELDLDDNLISDISPLYGLTNLTTLYIDENNIKKIEAKLETIESEVAEA